MKISIFGASGKTGTEFVRQSLSAGHHIKALVREPVKLTLSDEKFTVVRGDVLDAAVVRVVVNASDVVISVLGSKPDTSPQVLTVGTQNIISAMQQNHNPRLIVMSSYPMGGSPRSMAFLEQLNLPKDQQTAMQSMIDDKIGQETAVKNSGLNWTIIRPLMLTDGPLTGRYRTGENLDVKPGNQISHADVADFILKNLEPQSPWTDKIVTLAY